MPLCKTDKADRVMTFQELQGLAQAGIVLQVSASDLLQVLVELQQSATPLRRERRFVNLQEAQLLYGKQAKTLRKYIAEGSIEGEKVGGEWWVERPEDRQTRLANARAHKHLNNKQL